MAIKSGLNQEGHSVLRHMDGEELRHKFCEILSEGANEKVCNSTEGDRNSSLDAVADVRTGKESFSETASRAFQSLGIAIEIVIGEDGAACYVVGGEGEVIAVKYGDISMLERAFMECVVAYKKQQEGKNA